MSGDGKFRTMRNRKHGGGQVSEFFGTEEERVLNDEEEQHMEEEEEEEEELHSIEQLSYDEEEKEEEDKKITSKIDWGNQEEEEEEFLDASESLGDVMRTKKKGFKEHLTDNIIKKPIYNGKFLKFIYCGFIFVSIVFIVFFLSTRTVSRRKIIFVNQYENDISFLQRNSWKYQEDKLFNDFNIRTENDLKKQFWLWMAQWRIIGNARLDNRYTSEIFGPSLSIEEFDNEFTLYTNLHGFCSSAFVEVPLKYPIPKACGCQLSDNSTTIFYFPFITEKSKKVAQVIDSLHYIPNKQVSSIIPVEITLLYTNKNMTVIKKRILRNEDVHCIIRCEEMMDNRDYITEFLPKEY